MENIYNSIPYPNFSISDIITQKAKSFARTYLLNVRSFYNGVINDSIRTQLSNLNDIKDRTQFVVYLINHINTMVAEHLPTCITENCQVVPKSQEVLYYLYGQLNEFGIETDVDAFTTDETYRNNSILKEIIIKLEQFKIEHEQSEASLKQINKNINEAESLQGLQVLGKDKWYKLVGAFLLQYTATITLDEVIKASIIGLLLSLGKIPHYFMIN